MGEQLEFEIDRKCDKCDQFKLSPFSYFTEKVWVCADCKLDLIEPLDGSNFQATNDEVNSLVKEIYTSLSIPQAFISCVDSINKDGIIYRDCPEACQDVSELLLYHLEVKNEKD